MTVRTDIVDAMKRPKADVNYSPGHPNSRCGICKHFREPSSCELVQGRIDKSYWCELFDKKS